MTTHHGSTVYGEDYEIDITRGTTFNCYDIAGMARLEVVVEDGVITVTPLPDEMNEWQARAIAALLMEAADELERGE